MTHNNEKKKEIIELPLQAKDEGRIPGFDAIISAGLIATAIMAFTALSHKQAPWEDLTNGMPEKGELGFGKFLIKGVTFPFEYPFRLDQPQLVSTLSAWLLYIPHQIAQWLIIFHAKQAKAKGELDWTPSNRVNKYAQAMFKLNVLFAILHYLQSHLFYDGLAGSFPEISTLFAGVSSLIMIFIIEFKRRGVAFKWTPETGRESLFEFVQIVKEYHGYLGSFAITLTFWYHTMESTFAHITGFFHIFLLLAQSTLLFQNAHRNRYWTALLEFWILVHGSVVAYYQGILDGYLYKMFFSSFALLFIMSLVWGLPFIVKFMSANQPWRFWVVLAPFVSAWSILVYFFYKDRLEFLGMTLALPALYYFYVLWYYGFFLAGKKLDAILVDLGVERKSQPWFVAMTAVGVTSICSIMAISEFIYRLFVPYT